MSYAGRDGVIRVDGKFVAWCSATANRHHSIRALKEVAGDGDTEARLLDHAVTVAADGDEKVFILRHGTRFTPDPGRAPEDLTREMPIRHSHGDHTPSEAECFLRDEAFFIGIATDVSARRELDTRGNGKRMRGPITRRPQPAVTRTMQGRRACPADPLIHCG